MRVVYLADAPYVHTQRWVRHFAARGWDAHVISFRPAAIDGATVHYIDGLERLGKARYLLHARRVALLIARLEPALVHALHLTSYGFLAGRAGFQPSIVSVWGTDVLEAPAVSPLHRWLTRQALARAGAVTATGLRLAEATLPHTPRGKPVAVIPYGVELERFANARPGRGPAEDVTIGAVARLSPEKGLDGLLRALAELRGHGHAARVTLAGDGPARAGLEAQARALGIERYVRFLGAVPHEDVPAVLRTFDIFAMPSTAEGFGVAAVEAAAAALPVVASDVHGIPDVVLDGVTGLLVAPRDATALAEALARLAGDAGLRTRMGEAGRAYVARHYRWRDNAALMERLYEEVLRRTPATA